MNIEPGSDHRPIAYTEVSPNAWDDLLNHSTDRKNIQKLEKEADALCQQLAQLGAYLSARGGGGSEDRGHEEALKYSQKILRDVRKALGYTNP